MKNTFRADDVQMIQNHFAAFGLSLFQSEVVTYLLLEGPFDPKGPQTVIDALETFCTDDDRELVAAIEILHAFGDDARLNSCMSLLIEYAHANMI